MPKFEEAGLPMITPGATNAALSTNGWTTFHRILANDDKQGPGIAKLMVGAGFTKIGVVDDASEYGKGLGDTVRKELGANKVADDTIDPKASDFSAAVNKMKGAGVDAVFYSGYYAEAAKFVKQMRDAGLEAVFVSGDGSLDPKFVENAGAAAEGALLTATGAPSDVNPDFAAKFQAKFNTPPKLYSPEAYDCAKVFLAAIAAGNVTRESIAAFIDAYDQPGITKQIKFTPEGEPAGDAVYSYKVEGGKIVSTGIIA
jgi:branched-chain amino acid transport system substrate-binding protein